MTATGYAETLDLSELGNCVVNESFKNFILRFLISPYTAFIPYILRVILGFSPLTIQPMRFHSEENRKARCGVSHSHQSMVLRLIW